MIMSVNVTTGDNQILNKRVSLRREIKLKNYFPINIGIS